MRLLLRLLPNLSEMTPASRHRLPVSLNGSFSGSCGVEFLPATENKKEVGVGYPCRTRGELLLHVLGGLQRQFCTCGSSFSSKPTQLNWEQHFWEPFGFFYDLSWSSCVLQRHTEPGLVSGTYLVVFCISFHSFWLWLQSSHVISKMVLKEVNKVVKERVASNQRSFDH